MLSSFSAKFREVLKLFGTSQKVLAAELGTTQQTVSRWVNGEVQPDIDTILYICFYFDISPNELLGWDDIKDEGRNFLCLYKEKYSFKYAAVKK